MNKSTRIILLLLLLSAIPMLCAFPGQTQSNTVDEDIHLNLMRKRSVLTGR